MLDGSMQSLYLLIAIVAVATVMVLALGRAVTKVGGLRSRIAIALWLVASLTPAAAGWAALFSKVMTQ